MQIDSSTAGNTAQNSTKATEGGKATLTDQEVQQRVAMRYK